MCLPLSLTEKRSGIQSCCLRHLTCASVRAQYVRIKRSGGSSPGQTTLFLQRFRLQPTPFGADADEIYFTISQTSTATK